MTLSRRDFFKGLLASIAMTALPKNGVLCPEQAIAEPERRIFDMAANTWRDSLQPPGLFPFRVSQELVDDSLFTGDIRAFAHWNCSLTADQVVAISAAELDAEFMSTWYKPTPDCPDPVCAYQTIDGKLVQVYPVEVPADGEWEASAGWL